MNALNHSALGERRFPPGYGGGKEEEQKLGEKEEEEDANDRVNFPHRLRPFPVYIYSVVLAAFPVLPETAKSEGFADGD